MHIAIASTEFVTEKTYSGGLANYSANLARLLRKHGHDVSVFVLSSMNEEFIWNENIKVYRVCYNDYPAKIKKIRIKLIRRSIRFIWNVFGRSYVINKMIKTVNKRQKIDIVHFCNSSYLGLLRSKRIPTVVRLSNYPALMRHVMMPVYDYNAGINDLRLTDKLELAALRRADDVFGPSYNIAKLTEQKIKRNVQVIESPFLISIDKIDDTLYAQELSHKKYFIFYGTLSYLKGIHVISEALVSFFQKYPDHFFVFVGCMQKMIYKGTEVDAIDYVYKMLPQYRNKILYFSALSNKEQLYSLVLHAEACVLPSRIENLSNACIESMALGQIVIGTDGASFEQLIDDGYNGFLIERDNAEQLYQKMVQVLDMPEDEKRVMRDRAKETVARLNPDNIYEQIIELYQSVIKKKTGR